MENNKLVKFSLRLPIAMTLLLIAIKFVAFKQTGSLSIFSSFMDSFLDLVSSAISYGALMLSLKPKDAKHRFGHSGIVDIATSITAIFILITATSVISKSIRNIVAKELIEYSFSGIVVMASSMSASILLSMWLFYVYHKTSSLLIKNEIAHYFMDILTNGGILLSLFITKFYNHYLIDPIIALIMISLTIRPAVELLMSSYHNIMSREIPRDLKRKALAVLLNDKRVLGFHEMKTRRSGESVFIQCHVELDKNLTLMEAATISDDLEVAIKNSIANSEVIIKCDPKYD